MMRENLSIYGWSVGTILDNQGKSTRKHSLATFTPRFNEIHCTLHYTFLAITEHFTQIHCVPASLTGNIILGIHESWLSEEMNEII
jgi:hypothetical protein